MFQQGTFLIEGNDTPESIARKRALAGQMMYANRAPKNVGEGLHAVGQAIAARRMRGEADSAWKKGREGASSAMEPILKLLSKGNATNYGQAPSGNVSPNAAEPTEQGNDARYIAGNTPSSKFDPNLGENSVYSGFMGAVKSKIKNPFALSAIASTGMAESGFKKKNAFGRWNDPSERGVNGQSGGVMSWREGRLRNMQAFAKSRGEDPMRPSPSTQAEFFLQEDPGLIEKLRGAKSADEAQGMMNNAWRFAGYNRNSPEVSRRSKYANDFLQKYQSGAQQTPAPAQVAALAPNNVATDAPQALPGFNPQGDPIAAEAAPMPPVQQVEADPYAPTPVQTQSMPVEQPAQMAQAQPQPQPQQQGNQIDPSLLLKALSNPFITDAEKSVIQSMLKRQMEGQKQQRGISVGGRIVDPTTGRVIYEPPAGDGGDTEYGLNPQYGVDAQGNPVLIQVGKDGTTTSPDLPDGVTLSNKPIKMDAGTHFVLIDPITRQPVGQVPKQLETAEAQKAAGKAIGKGQGEAQELFTSMQSKLPGLTKVISKLDALSEKATYTYAGQARDALAKQTGFGTTEGALARTEYKAIVDNQVLPLLRETFGAAFTVEEGKSLKATLGDETKSPEEKQVVLNAFIQQKIRDLKALAARTGNTAKIPPTPNKIKTLKYNPATGKLE